MDVGRAGQYSARVVRDGNYARDGDGRPQVSRGRHVPQIAKVRSRRGVRHMHVHSTLFFFFLPSLLACVGGGCTYLDMGTPDTARSGWTPPSKKKK